MDVTLWTAFFGGVISFLSPCVLPVVPTYLAVLAGGSREQARRRTLYVNAVCFLLGLTVVFVAMGATASYLGMFFSQYQVWIRKAGAVFMIAMGAYMAGVLSSGRLDREYRPLLGRLFTGAAGAFVLGVGLTAGWTPCIGPILTSILTYAGATATVSQGMTLLGSYAAGFCVPFLITAWLWENGMARLHSWYKWLPYLHKISGVALILIGIVVYFDYLPRLLALFAPWLN